MQDLRKVSEQQLAGLPMPMGYRLRLVRYMRELKSSQGPWKSCKLNAGPLIPTLLPSKICSLPVCAACGTRVETPPGLVGTPFCSLECMRATSSQASPQQLEPLSRVQASSHVEIRKKLQSPEPEAVENDKYMPAPEIVYGMAKPAALRPCPSKRVKKVEEEEPINGW